MSESQDRPGGRTHSLPGDRRVAGMPSDDAVEGRVVGSPVERTDRPGDAPAAPSTETTTPQPSGPATGGGRGPLPGRTGRSDRERDETTAPTNPRGERPGKPGATDTDRAGATRSDGPNDMIEPGSAADPLGERTAGPAATARSYAHGGSSAPTMAPHAGSSPGLDDGPPPGRAGEQASTGGRPGKSGSDTDGTGAGGPSSDRLIGKSDADRFETRWHEVKAAFVDDPRDSVKQASALCEEAVRALTTALDEQRRGVEQVKGDGADTERLRTALRSYGEFVQRLTAL